ncbi:efflux RND transporter permease subunit [Mucisphaera calidilacus]|uniref:Efflux pump membrane transporter BepE n=1 Tax=Mucisphaera calidilacus TaxID=2527982 RepID=A0A518C140_9BACT|nr:efflux RND transporter permease subunit [Mucisphaera calidilacus]QDU72939.1 Efflux pump membrane transporter BepE [Mucisphaera calidilacus]
MNIIRFGVEKPVPVNLLMTALLLAGIYYGLSLRKEFFPEQDPTEAQVTLPYPGATPEEIEETLAIKVEDALTELDEVKDLTSSLSEGGGGIIVEFREGVNVDDAVDEVEKTIDALQDLPDEAEDITVDLFEPELHVIRVTIFGELDEAVLKRAIHGVRDDLRTLPGMGDIRIEGLRDYEMRIDLEPEALFEHGVSLPEVADRIRNWMLEVPGGTVRAVSGNIRVRTMGVEERDDRIREIPIFTRPDGTLVRLGEIARVTDSFVDSEVTERFNTLPSASLVVYKVNRQDIVRMAEMVRAYVGARKGEDFVSTSVADRLALAGVLGESDRLRAWRLGRDHGSPLPPGAQIQMNSDLARFVEGRLDLLLRNAFYGAMLVFATVLCFLNWRVAIWVGIGLLTALAGTIMLMAWSDITLNLLTMFGLIVVIGILVDDAIVVSENIQARHDRGEPALLAAVRGTRQVAWPVVATVLTSVVAFLPLTFIEGRIGDLLGALPAVVACALLMSLIESLIILPSHLGHSLLKRDERRESHPDVAPSWTEKFEAWRDSLIHDRIIPAYARTLGYALNRRYVSLSVAVAVLSVSMGMFQGGHVAFVFLPADDAETIMANLRMPIGTPVSRTEQVVERLELAIQAQPETKSITSVIGQSTNLDSGSSSDSPHLGQIFIELIPVEDRDLPADDIIANIRNALSDENLGAERLTFERLSGGPGGPDITIRISGKDQHRINEAVNDAKRLLSGFDGVFDIFDNQNLGQLEMRFHVTPSGAALGFDAVNVARQVRGALYGIDAHVFADREEDIDVRVRLDESMRRDLGALERLWVIAPGGQSVPLMEIARVEESLTYASITRVNRNRAVTVTAETAPSLSPELVTSEITEADPATGRSSWDDLRDAYPDLMIEFAGRQEQEADAFRSLPYGFLAAMIMIYVILAWLFSSYIQPLLVLMGVPFAIIGVIWGHWFLDYNMTFLSLIGFVALSGIVVNDSLIYVKFVNQMLERGYDMPDALVEAGRARFRPIALTTITTVLGLTPLLLETSFQARFLIPMAISIAAGLISATFLILLLLPCLLLILEDINNALHWLWYGEPRPRPDYTPVVIPNVDEMGAVAEEEHDIGI